MMEEAGISVAQPCPQWEILQIWLITEKKSLPPQPKDFITLPTMEKVGTDEGKTKQKQMINSSVFYFVISKRF